MIANYDSFSYAAQTTTATNKYFKVFVNIFTLETIFQIMCKLDFLLYTLQNMDKIK